MTSVRRGIILGLSEYRREVETIDYEIIRLIDRRTRLAGNIFSAKKAEGIDISQPGQERVVLNRATDLATELGVDPGAVREVFAILIRMSLDKQHEMKGEE